MPRTSQRQQVIRDLTWLGIFTNVASDDGLVHGRTRRYHRSIGGMGVVETLRFRRKRRLARWIDMEFSDEATILDILQVVTTLRYINARWKEPHLNPFELTDMLRSRETEFRQAMRTDHEGPSVPYQ
ncbi:hypothetical protein DFH28DRAFT_37922 [Melampsora americana]|nr:hypothetical protein DFH28DRAFT_37922 [Melampsora americana]